MLWKIEYVNCFFVSFMKINTRKCKPAFKRLKWKLCEKKYKEMQVYYASRKISKNASW